MTEHWGKGGTEAAKRPFGFYWIHALDKGPEVAEWTDLGWQLCGSDELFDDSELGIVVIAGPLDAPGPDHVPTANPPPAQASEDKQ